MTAQQILMPFCAYRPAEARRMLAVSWGRLRTALRRAGMANASGGAAGVEIMPDDIARLRAALRKPTGRGPRLRWSGQAGTTNNRKTEK